MSNASASTSDAILEIEAIEAEVDFVRATVRAEGRVISAAERNYLDELLLERARIFRMHQCQIEETRLRAQLQGLYAYARHRDRAIQQMRYGSLAVAAGMVLTLAADANLVSGEMLPALWAVVGLGGVRFARGLTTYIRR